MMRKQDKTLLYAGAAVAAYLLLSGRKVTNTGVPLSYPNPLGSSRGLRNNNPGNIILTDSQWKGEVQGPDEEFKAFKDVRYGIAAIYYNLNAYFQKHGLNTVEKIGLRWTKTQQTEWIKFVSSCMNLSKVNVLKFDEKTITNLAKCITKIENGSNAVNEIGEHKFADAWRLWVNGY